MSLAKLVGESVRQFAEEQYDRGRHRHRKHPRRVNLVGDPLRGRIVLVDVKDGNGHMGNGWYDGTAVVEGRVADAQ